MMMNGQHLFATTFLLMARTCLCDDQSSITQTVYGFLDFTTTIGNTVMVFSPQSAPLLDLNPIIETKPMKMVLSMREKKIQPTKPLLPLNSASFENIRSITKQTNIEDSKRSEKENKYEGSNSSVPMENNLFKANYNLLSRQPAEYAEETYRIVNLKPNSQTNGGNLRSPQIIKKSIATSSGNHPVGLVTRIDQTVSRNGFTTIYQTSVIGTYISGKYAQVLQSSEQVYQNDKSSTIPSVSAARVLKTASTLTSKPSLVQKENNLRHSAFIRAKSKTIDSAILKNDDTFYKSKIQIDYFPSRKSQQHKKSSNRRSKNSRSSVTKTIRASGQTIATEIVGRKSFRPKTQYSSDKVEASASLFMFKLNRTPGRWQYKTSPKPRVNIRRPLTESHAMSSRSDTINSSISSISPQYINETLSKNSALEQEGLERSTSFKSVESENDVEIPKYLIETINVEISTPQYFRDVYYEIITIKTPYTFQAGAVKKTRLITVTSTLEKTLEQEPTATSFLKGPLTENILAPSIRLEDLLLDTSVTTLAPIYLVGDSETPQLETTTETFSLTHRKLKTEVLPVVRSNNNTSYLTLIHTYDMTSLITATKTLSYGDSNQFIQFNSLTIFNSNLDEAGSELNLELEFDQNRSSKSEITEDHPEFKKVDLVLFNDKKTTATDVLNSAGKLSNSKIITPNESISSDQLQHLALLNLFNQNVKASKATNNHAVIAAQTIYESFVVPVINGITTSYRTLSKSVGIADKTAHALDTTPLQSSTSSISFNPFLMHLQQHFQVITSSVVKETVVTQTNSKVLKLTFGAKTAHTTLFSTNIVPTILTSLITTSYAVPNTAPFPGYFPPPYPPFPYVG